MREKFEVQVRNGDGSVVRTIKVVLRAESMGNFNPVFCTYKGRRCLVESDELHLDDPFRCREEDHVGRMFVRPRGENGAVVATWADVGKAVEG